MYRNSLVAAALLGAATLGVALAPRALAEDGDQAHTFQCCSKHTVTRVVEEYLDLQEKMHSSDESKPVSSELYALLGVVKRARKEGGFSTDDKAVLDKLQDLVNKHKDGKRNDLREPMQEISKYVVHLAMSHKGSGGLEVAEAYCEDGGVWLQRPGAIANPYGDSDCGAFR